MSKETIVIPSSRQKEPKPVFEREDRVATPSTTWYSPDDQRCQDFPQMFGTVISATEFSAKVLWDIDQDQTTLSTEKLTKIAKDTPFQMEDTEEICDRSIFKKKPARSARKKTMHQLMPDVNLSSSGSETEVSTTCKSPSIRINKKRPHIRSLKEISQKKLFTKVDAVSEQTEDAEKPTSSKDIIVVGKRTAKSSKTSAQPPAKKAKKQKAYSRRSNSAPQLLSSDVFDSSSSSESEDEEIDPEESDEEDNDVVKGTNQKSAKGSKKLTPEEKKDKKLQKEVDFGWKVGVRNIDKRGGACAYGPRLVNFEKLSTNELDYFLHFFPLNYLREVILPETNKCGQTTLSGWIQISVGEFLVWLGIRFVQETVRLSSIHDYWNTPQNGAFPAMNMETYMAKARFFQIGRVLKLAATAETEEEEVLAFIDVLNEAFQAALTPGSNLTVDESMIASRHKKLEGKKKIKRKPRPIGVEIKNLCDSKTMINLVLEKNESKERMAQKDHHADLGATTACTLRLTKRYHGSGRTVYGDSWFGSVKTCKELMDVGLYSTLIVKTAHVNFPRELLHRQGQINVGEHKSCLNEEQGIVAVRYLDKKEKQLISSCATTLKGKPKEKISKRTGQKVVIPRPKIFSDFCENAGSIDVYNHYRTGSVALEDTWKTLSPKLRQFAGLIGFIETNAFLALKHFCADEAAKKTIHSEFRKNLANLLLTNTLDQIRNQLLLRPKLCPIIKPEHDLVKLPKRGKCYMCSNSESVRVINQTLWCCSLCGSNRPLCSPNTGRQCFMDHVRIGFPSKKYRKSH